MRLLIDTQIFLWLFLYPKRVSTDVVSLLKNPASNIFFSAASAWEIAIKFGNGKLHLPDKPEIFVPSRAGLAGFWLLPIIPEHALQVADLPFHHKDPFDRLIIAQAKYEKLIILTTDLIFRKYTSDFIDAEKYKEPIN